MDVFNLSQSIKIFIYAKPVDMRNGYNGLQGLVSNEMEMSVQEGCLFLFINKQRNRLKVLYWSGDGLSIYMKRLEEGTFKRPTARIDSPNSELTQAEFYMILHGIDFEKTKKRKRYLSK